MGIAKATPLGQSRLEEGLCGFGGRVFPLWRDQKGSVPKSAAKLLRLSRPVGADPLHAWRGHSI
jgi:hypothetical protein